MHLPSKKFVTFLFSLVLAIVSTMVVVSKVSGEDEVGPTSPITPPLTSIVTETPTPTQEPEPTDEPEPTVTPTPTETPSNSNSNSNSSSNTTSASAPVCVDGKPNLPTHFTAVAGPEYGQVTLFWTKPMNPPSFTYFLIAYSNTDTMKWGNPNIGNVDSFTVNGLSAGTYKFWLRAGNGCMPGDFVGPVTVKISRGFGSVGAEVATGFEANVFGASTSDETESSPSATITTTVDETASQSGQVNGDAVSTEPSTCATCVVWPIVILEVAVLAGYYFFMNKGYEGANQLYVGAAVGAVAYIIFMIVNRGCASTSFFCRYFLLVDGAIYGAISYFWKRFTNE